MLKKTNFAATNVQPIISFLIVGVINTLVYIGLFVLFWYVLRLNHFMSVTAAFTLAASFQFLANRKFTFKVQNNVYFNEALKFSILLIINYLVSLILPKLSLLFFNTPLLGAVLTAAVNPLISYILFNKWIFLNKSIFQEK